MEEREGGQVQAQMEVEVVERREGRLGARRAICNGRENLLYIFDKLKYIFPWRPQGGGAHLGSGHLAVHLSDGAGGLVRGGEGDERGTPAARKWGKGGRENVRTTSRSYVEGLGRKSAEACFRFFPCPLSARRKCRRTLRAASAKTGGLRRRRRRLDMTIARAFQGAGRGEART